MGRSGLGLVGRWLASVALFYFALQRRARVDRSLACAWLRVHVGSLTTKIPSNPASNSARAKIHQQRQEQHAVDSSLLAALASAGDEAPGGDGAMSGDELRAPLRTGAREPTPWGNRATGDDRSRGSMEKTNGFLWWLEFAIWCLDIVLDALQHIQRRARQERTSVQPPV